MLDESDSDDWWMFAALAPYGWRWLLVLILVAIIVTVVVCRNEAVCEAHACPSGQKARLIAHECLCVQPVVEGKP